MRISYNWLKDYVNVNLPAERLGEILTMSGFPVESIEKVGTDHILEIEVTANRPDALSVIGIAREIAALTGHKLKIPRIVHSPQSTVHSPKAPNTQYPILNTIRVEDAKLCPRYTGRVIRGVKVGDSPAWLKSRIEMMGLRPVNNIVDITNFCLFETGEPMHAFDLDKISGGEVIIRKARKGEKIVTIDSVERELDESVLVIADASRAIAIAGVMGGLNTEVTFPTNNILLEAACFDPVSVRRTSRKLGISSESSYRFERRVDAGNIPYSSNRAADLISGIAAGRPGEIFDIGKSDKTPGAIGLRYSRLNKMLGIEIPPAKARNILNSLGLKVKTSGKDKISLRIPGFRNDLKGEIDLIEEVARIYGYNKIPDTMPAIVEQPIRKSIPMKIEGKIREILTGLGVYEIITYGLLSKKLLKEAGIPGKGCVEIANPLSSEQEVMRPSLIPGMLNAMAWNINRKSEDLKLFEVGNVYIKESSGKFKETMTLSIGMTGQIQSSWADRPRKVFFSDLMGTFETLLSEFGIGPLSYSVREAGDERFSAAACAAIGIENEDIGMAGEVSQKILKEFDIKDTVYVLEINIKPLLRRELLEKRFEELPKFPSIFRDISIIIGKDIKNRDIVSSIKNTAGPILKDTTLIDRYAGKQIPDGKIGLTYRLEYRDPKKTLEEKDVSGVHAKVLHELEEKLAAKLR